MKQYVPLQQIVKLEHILEHPFIVRLGMAGCQKFAICTHCGDISYLTKRGGLFIIRRIENAECPDEAPTIPLGKCTDPDILRRGFDALQRYVRDGIDEYLVDAAHE